MPLPLLLVMKRITPAQRGSNHCRIYVSEVKAGGAVGCFVADAGVR